MEKTFENQNDFDKYMRTYYNEKQYYMNYNANIMRPTQCYAKAISDYTVGSNSGLTFNNGANVVVTDTSNPEWWQGYVKGNPNKVGAFPSNSVVVMANAMFDYPPEDSKANSHKNDIKFKNGANVMVTDMTNPHWWEGYVNGSPEKKGYFPSTFVQLKKNRESGNASLNANVLNRIWNIYNTFKNDNNTVENVNEQAENVNEVNEQEEWNLIISTLEEIQKAHIDELEVIETFRAPKNFEEPSNDNESLLRFTNEDVLKYSKGDIIGLTGINNNSANCFSLIELILDTHAKIALELTSAPLSSETKEVLRKEFEELKPKELFQRAKEYGIEEELIKKVLPKPLLFGRIIHSANKSTIGDFGVFEGKHLERYSTNKQIKKQRREQLIKQNNNNNNKGLIMVDNEWKEMDNNVQARAEAEEAQSKSFTNRSMTNFLKLNKFS